MGNMSDRYLTETERVEAERQHQKHLLRMTNKGVMLATAAVVVGALYNSGQEIAYPHRKCARNSEAKAAHDELKKKRKQKRRANKKNKHA